MLIVPLNATAPTSLTLRFLSPLFGPDLTLVTAVSTSVLRRDGTTATLVWTIVSATSRELVAQYTFAGGELTTTGAYYLAPSLAYQGGHVQAETVPLFVGGPYNCIPQLEQDAGLLATVPVNSAGPVRGTWRTVSSSITASPFLPHMRLDLRNAPLAVTLWAPNDGDVAVFSDVYNAAASHAFTLNAGAGQSVPVGDGTFATSTTRSAAGFTLRLRFDASDNLWLPW